MYRGYMTDITVDITDGSSRKAQFFSSPLPGTPDLSHPAPSGPLIRNFPRAAGGGVSFLAFFPSSISTLPQTVGVSVYWTEGSMSYRPLFQGDELWVLDQCFHRATSGCQIQGGCVQVILVLLDTCPIKCPV